MQTRSILTRCLRVIGPSGCICWKIWIIEGIWQNFISFFKLVSTFWTLLCLWQYIVCHHICHMPVLEKWERKEEKDCEWTSTSAHIQTNLDLLSHQPDTILPHTFSFHAIHSKKLWKSCLCEKTHNHHASCSVFSKGCTRFLCLNTCGLHLFFETHLKAARTEVSFTARGRSVPLTGTDEYVSKLTVSKIVLMIIHEIVSSIKSKRSLDFNLGSGTAKV